MTDQTTVSDGLAASLERTAWSPQCRVSFDGEAVCINGAPTFPGTSLEGLLPNLRTVNATFDDTLGQVDWWDDDGRFTGNGHAGYGQWRSARSAKANTQRFIKALPQYRAHGILAVNLNFQGGHPLMSRQDIEEGHGSAGRRPDGHRDFYHNSGFHADGTMDEAYAERICSVIEACDRLGMVVVLQLFYFGQDTALRDETAVCAAVDHAVDLVCVRGFTNVLVEIANEVMHGHYHHDVLMADRVHELINQARTRARQRHGVPLLVSTSEAAMLHNWHPAEIERVFSCADFILCHGGDNVETGRVGDTSDVVDKVEYLRAQPWFQQAPKPIVLNESDGPEACRAAMERHVSFGLHCDEIQTMYPPRWWPYPERCGWFFDMMHDAAEPTG